MIIKFESSENHQIISDHQNKYICYESRTVWTKSIQCNARYNYFVFFNYTLIIKILWLFQCLLSSLKNHTPHQSTSLQLTHIITMLKKIFIIIPLIRLKTASMQKISQSILNKKILFFFLKQLSRWTAMYNNNNYSHTIVANTLEDR